MRICDCYFAWHRQLLWAMMDDRNCQTCFASMLSYSWYWFYGKGVCHVNYSFRWAKFQIHVCTSRFDPNTTLSTAGLFRCQKTKINVINHKLMHNCNAFPAQPISNILENSSYCGYSLCNVRFMLCAWIILNWYGILRWYALCFSEASKIGDKNSGNLWHGYRL